MAIGVRSWTGPVGVWLLVLCGVGRPIVHAQPVLIPVMAKPAPGSLTGVPADEARPHPALPVAPAVDEPPTVQPPIVLNVPAPAATANPRMATAVVTRAALAASMPRRRQAAAVGRRAGAPAIPIQPSARPQPPPRRNPPFPFG
jgi:hypothetical protein